jgi:hypothetical protein
LGGRRHPNPQPEARDAKKAAQGSSQLRVGPVSGPEAEALSEMARLAELGRLSLPIGTRTPLREAAEASLTFVDAKLDELC